LEVGYSLAGTAPPQKLKDGFAKIQNYLLGFACWTSLYIYCELLPEAVHNGKDLHDFADWQDLHLSISNSG